MNDEQPIVNPGDNYYPATTKLDDLPDFMKVILNEFISFGFGGQKTKTEFEKKFPRYEDILPAARGTYEAYIHNHYDTIMEAVAITAATVQTVREGLQQAVDLAESILGDDNASTKQQIESLKNFMVGRIEFLRTAQGTGIPSAQLENTISSYVNGLRTLIEKSIEYGKELNQEDENQIEVYMESLIDEFLEAIVEIYKQLHGENKLQEFEIAMGSKLGDILKSALQEKKDDDSSTPSAS